MTTEKLLISQFLDWLNAEIKAERLALPAYVSLGSPLYTTGKGLWAQMQGKAQPSQKYLRGRYRAILSFGLYYRLSEPEIGGIEARMLLPSETLEDYLYTHKPTIADFLIIKIAQTNGAVPFSRSDTGELTYQSLWQIEFEVK